MKHQVRFAAFAIFLLGYMTVAAQLLAQATSADNYLGAQPVTFNSGDEIFCRGVALNGYVLTAKHCIDATLNSVTPYMRIGDKTVAFSPAQVPDLNGKVYSLRGASAGADFALIDMDPTRDKFRDSYSDLGDAQVGDMVKIGLGDGHYPTCHIDSVCGGDLFYTCDTPTQPGWSGSGIWTVTGGDRPTKLIGVHTNGSGRGGSGTAFKTVLGRNTELFASVDAYSDRFAKDARLAYTWLPSTGQCHSDSKSLLTMKTTLSDRRVNAFEFTNDGAVLIYDDDKTQLCKFTLDNLRSVTCVKNTGPANRLIIAIFGLGGDIFAMPEYGGDANPETVKGAIDFIAGRSLAINPAGHPRAIADVGTVRTVAMVGNDLIAGGDRGLCVVQNDKCPCDYRANGLCANPWRVTGILPLDGSHFLAVGRDHDDHIAYPACVWGEKKDGRWTVVGTCDKSLLLEAEMRDFNASRRDLQFQSPLLVSGRAIAFATDGGAYELCQGRADFDGNPSAVDTCDGVAAKKIPILGLTDAHSENMEDAVRGAGSVDASHIIVTGDDGAVRVLKLCPGASGDYLLAKDGWTMPEVSATVTAIRYNKPSLLAKGKDGVLTILDTQPLLAAIQDLRIKEPNSTKRLEEECALH